MRLFEPQQVERSHAERLRERNQLVIEHRSAAIFDLRNLRPGEHDPMLGQPAAQILLRDLRPRGLAELAHLGADDVAGVRWFFAFQYVPDGHVDLSGKAARVGACRAQLIVQTIFG